MMWDSRRRVNVDVSEDHQMECTGEDAHGWMSACARARKVFPKWGTEPSGMGIR